MVAVEHIGRIDVAHVIGGAQLPGCFHSGGDQLIRADGGKCAGNMELMGKVGVGAGTLGNDDVIQVDVLLNRACRANPQNVLHAVAVKKLVGVDAHRGHTHTGGHHRHLYTVISAGIALNTADVVDQNRVFQEVFSNEFGPQRVTGHQYGLCKITGLCGNVGGGGFEHCKFLLNGWLYDIFRGFTD